MKIYNAKIFTMDAENTVIENGWVEILGSKITSVGTNDTTVDENDIDAALETIDEEQEIQTASEILEKYMRHKTRDKETLQKAYRYLMGKGFEYETIRAALKAYGTYEED